MPACAKIRGLLYQGGYGAGPIEKRKGRMDMEMDKGQLWHLTFHKKCKPEQDFFVL
jgi:hypothetical protein